MYLKRSPRAGVIMVTESQSGVHNQRSSNRPPKHHRYLRRTRRRECCEDVDTLQEKRNLKFHCPQSIFEKSTQGATGPLVAAAAASSAPAAIPPLGLEAAAAAAPAVASVAVVAASPAVSSASSSSAAAPGSAEASSGASALSSFIHADGAAVQGFAVHAFLRVFGVLHVLEFHEAEAAGVTGISVADNIDLLDGAELAEGLGEGLLVGVEAQASDEQLPFVRHGDA
ncbi:hypothetical protein EYF80_045586 [Liparis tanakae]|uniref:Uncharacterized protein n=1 Tax=Liparis tanakae TaxID=230148 RepID=A0A4Z2FT69_9TELE|nr:hypothetical protein EYF80_045586 [Liparis tanakae]